jgi:magnesium-transporting ATPase (P-type)
MDENDLVVDESIYGRGIDVVKEESRILYPQNQNQGYEEEDNHKQNPDPFLFTDSKVMKGYGKAVVVCVGENTMIASKRKPEELTLSEEKTELEKKLEQSSVHIAKYAKIATAICLITSIIFYVFLFMFNNKEAKNPI